MATSDRSEKRRLRACRLGYVQSVPAGYVHILVPQELETRARSQIKALVLHDKINREVGRPFHYLAEAIEVQSKFSDPSITRSSRMVNRSAAEARHSWGGSDQSSMHAHDSKKIPAKVDDELPSTSILLFPEPDLKDGKVTLLLDELVRQDNDIDVSGCDYDPRNSAFIHLVSANEGIGDGTQDALHARDLFTSGVPVFSGISIDSKIYQAGDNMNLFDASRGLSTEATDGKDLARLFEHAGSRKYIDPASAPRWADCIGSDGSDYTTVEEDMSGITHDKCEKEYSSKDDGIGFADADKFVENPTDLHDKDLLVKDVTDSSVCDKFDKEEDGAPGILHGNENIKPNSGIDVTARFGIQHDNENIEVLHDKDLCVKDVTDSSVGACGFAESSDAAAEIEDIHDNDIFDNEEDGASEILHDKHDENIMPNSGIDVTPRFGLLHDNENIGVLHDKDLHVKARVWEHMQLEPIIAAPWRRRRKLHCAYDMTVLDFPEDGLKKDLEPPGCFSFATKPGFGIRNLLANEDENTNLHDNVYGTNNSVQGSVCAAGDLHGKDGDLGCDFELAKSRSVDFPACARTAVSDGDLGCDFELAKSRSADTMHTSHLHDTDNVTPVDPLHGNGEQGFVYMLASPGELTRDGKWVECTDLFTVHLLAKMAVSRASEAAIKTRIERSSFLWKDRAHEERKKLREVTAHADTRLHDVVDNMVEVFDILRVPCTRDDLLDDFDVVFDVLKDHCKSLMEIEGYNDDLLRINSELKEQLVEKEHTIDNLKLLNTKLLNEMRVGKQMKTSDWAPDHDSHPGKFNKNENSRKRIGKKRNNTSHETGPLGSTIASGNENSRKHAGKRRNNTSHETETGPLGSPRNLGNTDFFESHIVAGKSAATDTSVHAQEDT